MLAMVLYQATPRLPGPHAVSRHREDIDGESFNRESQSVKADRSIARVVRAKPQSAKNVQVDSQNRSHRVRLCSGKDCDFAGPPCHANEAASRR